MAYELDRLSLEGIGAEELRRAIETLRTTTAGRYRRLWAYYRNPMLVCGVGADDSGSQRPYRQAQEWGLPSRITGRRAGQEPGSGCAVGDIARKEIVIENDIGWRVDTMVDYLFGKSPNIASTAGDPRMRAVVEQLVGNIIDNHGGPQFLQQMALLGAVYGFVDVLVKFVPPTQASREGGGGTGRWAAPQGAAAPSQLPSIEGATAGETADEHSSDRSLDDLADPGASTCSPEAIARLARMIVLEIVQPARALPLFSPADGRNPLAYVVCYELPRKAAATPTNAQQPAQRSWMRRLRESAGRMLSAGPGRETPSHAGEDRGALVVEIITPTRWQKYEDERLVAEGENSIGALPLAHIQNAVMPFAYEGAGDVEPLIPLQDELNTRLCDRANRITLQSFKMYLGKHVDDFVNLPIAPGRMWSTDDERAEVIQFGGDDNCPSESLHIEDMREALDKTSGVTPIAAGAIKNRIGRLTSAAALRITLLSLLSRTEKKRTAYGAGLKAMMSLALAWLDRAGLLRTSPEDRGIELNWQSPLPENDVEKLEEARIKADLGVPRAVVLKELGYSLD